MSAPAVSVGRGRKVMGLSLVMVEKVLVDDGMWVYVRFSVCMFCPSLI